MRGARKLKLCFTRKAVDILSDQYDNDGGDMKRLWPWDVVFLSAEWEHSEQICRACEEKVYGGGC